MADQDAKFPPFVALHFEHKGEQHAWVIDERGDVFPVPVSTFAGLSTIGVTDVQALQSKGWRYATREEYEAAKDRALNSTDN